MLTSFRKKDKHNTQEGRNSHAHDHDAYTTVGGKDTGILIFLNHITIMTFLINSMEKGGNIRGSNHHHMFLCGIGLIFSLAFASYHVQFPGLVSSSGIEPASRSLSFAFPTLGKILQEKFRNRYTFMISVDILCELCTTLGVLISCIAAR